SPERSPPRALRRVLLRVVSSLGSALLHPNPVPSLVDDIERIQGTAVAATAEKHLQLARLMPAHVDVLASQTVPEIPERRLHIVVASDVTKMPIRNVVDQAFQQEAGVVTRNNAVIVELPN